MSEKSVNMLPYIGIYTLTYIGLVVLATLLKTVIPLGAWVNAVVALAAVMVVLSMFLRKHDRRMSSREIHSVTAGSWAVSLGLAYAVVWAVSLWAGGNAMSVLFGSPDTAVILAIIGASAVVYYLFLWFCYAIFGRILLKSLRLHEEARK